jgi:hypothetical protein
VFIERGSTSRTRYKSAVIPRRCLPRYPHLSLPSMNAASDLETAELAKRHVPMEVLPTEASLTDSDGFEKPTEEEMATLRRVSGKIPWAAYTIAFVELCERFSYYGTTAVCKLCKLPCSQCLRKLTYLQLSILSSNLCRQDPTRVPDFRNNLVLWIWANVPRLD